MIKIRKKNLCFEHVHVLPHKYVGKILIRSYTFHINTNYHLHSYKVKAGDHGHAHVLQEPALDFPEESPEAFIPHP